MRTAIFGGSFNPVHTGHVNLVREISERLKPDRIIVIPTFISPFKKDEGGFVATGAQRLEMCRLAFEDMPQVTVSDYEIALGGVSYTINTLKHFKELYPDDKLYFIMGSDMLLSFTLWKSYEEILRMCTVVAASREDNQADFSKLEDAAADLRRLGEVIVVPITPFKASSTEIRKKIFNSCEISCYVPKKVVKYISDTMLYGKK